MGMVGDAFEMALRAHAGQADKTGAAYIGHVARVAAGIEGGPDADTARIVALLHDVVEDTPVTLDEVRATFGAEVAEAVDAITHRPSENRMDYYKRVKANPIALIVKASDIADNTSPARMAFLDEATRDRLAQKYEKARNALGI